MSVRDIVSMSPGSVVDFLGVLLHVGRQYDTDKSSRLNIQLGDNELNIINCIVWNLDALKQLQDIMSGGDQSVLTETA